MNCCDHNADGSNENNQKHKHAHKGGHMSHMWMMALCCGAPIIILLAVFLLGSSLPGLKTVLLSIAPFLCPIMMLPMMLMHGRHENNGDGKKPDDQIEPLKIPERNRLD